MPRFDHDFQKYFKSRTSPTQYVEDYLIQLEELDVFELEFWQEYQTFLSEEREKLIDDIKDALLANEQKNFEDICWRVVKGKRTGDPLCTYGSLIDSGRYNFGLDISSHYKDFDCLYVADHHQTAYSEVFRYETGQTVGDGALTPEQMALSPETSFFTGRLKVRLESFIDLHNEDLLRSFLDVISQIQPTEEFQKRWKHLCKKLKKQKNKLNTIHSIDQLSSSLLEKNYKQWPIMMNLPSNSQWFGHYALLTGIQGIIYPSVRYEEGWNLAIFPQNFSESEALVEITDDVDCIHGERKRMDRTNYHFFKLKFDDYQKLVKERH